VKGFSKLLGQEFALKPGKMIGQEFEIKWVFLGVVFTQQLKAALEPLPSLNMPLERTRTTQDQFQGLP
jgi:hypothetical protein